MNKSVAVILLLSLGVGLGLALALVAPEPSEPQTVEWLDNPRSLGKFSLESSEGVFDNHSLVGHWTIVLFGFLHCPDICPTSLSQLSALADGLVAEPIGQEVKFVFVSVDPGRDSVAAVSQYVQHFDPSIRGVTGEEVQLTQFAGDLGIQFKVSSASDDYTVAHSITFSIIDPQGVFRGRFRPGHDVPSLVRSLTPSLKEGQTPVLPLAATSGPRPQC